MTAAGIGNWESSDSMLGQVSPEQHSSIHDQHMRLAGIVKGVHADLCKKYKASNVESGLERIWYKHCQNKSVLSKYADAVHYLAVDHWSKNNQETRIEWCRDVVNEYFKRDGLKKVLEKEKRQKEHERLQNVSMNSVTDANCKLCSNNDQSVNEDVSQPAATSFILVADEEKKPRYNSVDLPFQGHIRLLDVGSCFNPFLVFPEFKAVGIDINPATESVFHCDFLHLHTKDPLQVADDTMTTFINNLKDPVEWLPKECFHVVVFSLLLEYFPAPYQRWICCLKAHELLMFNGILVIVTLDLHQQHRNAAMIKSWKVAIESIGFKRWRYVKQEHLHCMVFRKIEVSEHDRHESFLKGISADMLYIPQDLHDAEADDFTADINGAVNNLDDEYFYKEHTINELPVLSSDSDMDDITNVHNALDSDNN